MAPFCFPLRRRDRFGRPALSASRAPETDGFSPLSGSFTVLPMAPRKALSCKQALSRSSLARHYQRQAGSPNSFYDAAVTVHAEQQAAIFSKKKHLQHAAFCL
ncbi:hypothetical protein [Shinella zoogloeoides]|uniref:hypothetical protein n=1 Tax=Shinella zoogloeoides TaxID=352475 RepID=UPI0013C3519C|nr:hypothetical protein [Shinella zoogloeoides]